MKETGIYKIEQIGGAIKFTIPVYKAGAGNIRVKHSFKKPLIIHTSGLFTKQQVASYVQVLMKLQSYTLADFMSMQEIDLAEARKVKTHVIMGNGKLWITKALTSNKRDFRRRICIL